jgi:hypothetical protein
MSSQADRLALRACLLALTLAATAHAAGATAPAGAVHAPAPAPPPSSPAAQHADAGPRPFRAEFVLEWKGMNAARASLELARVGSGEYSYVSRNTARGVFRAAFPGEVTQVSRLRFEDGQVRPLSYRGDEGSEDQRRDVSLDFDWQRRRVTGTAETRPVDLALQPGMQDIMSVQVALIVDLMAGRRPAGYVLVDQDRVKEYVYQGEGAARIATTLGPLDTVVWSSHRPNSDRVTRVWYAPSLGYAPVQAERRRGSRLEWSMRLVSLQR